MKIALFGGSGFVGNYIINELLAAGYIVNVLIRENSTNNLNHHNKCNVFTGSIEDKEVVEELIKKSDAIIYNIGIIREFLNKNITFESLHFNGAKLTIDSKKI